MKKYFYKNIEIIGFSPYVATYKLKDGKTIILYIADGNDTKKDVLEMARKNIDYMNKNN